MRLGLQFNEYDTTFDVDRTSCMGIYKVENGIPLNPKNRKGTIGRGDLRYWGPNHAMLIALVKLKKVQVLVRLKNDKEYELPWVSVFFEILFKDD